MVNFTNIIQYCNQTEGIPFQPNSFTNSNPAAGSDYNAATISGIVFGILMALLAIYSIWQYGQQYMRIYAQLLRQRRRDVESANNADIEVEHVDFEHQGTQDDIENQGSEET